MGVGVGVGVGVGGGCARSILRHTLCRVKYVFPHVARLHVDFKKWPCHSVEFRRHEPHHYHNKETLKTLFSSLRQR